MFQIICLVFTGYLALKGNILAGDIMLYQSYFATVAELAVSVPHCAAEGHHGNRRDRRRYQEKHKYHHGADGCADWAQYTDELPVYFL